jgi:ribosomal protein S18 acetylase RimI-like enzyme
VATTTSASVSRRDSNGNDWSQAGDQGASSGERAAAEQVVVREAVIADARSIARIGRAAVPVTYRDLIPDKRVMDAIVAQSYALDALRTSIDRCAVAHDAQFLVAELSERIVGFLHFDSDGAVPELHRIYVDPNRLRQGIGSALLTELHRRLRPGSSYVLMVVAANQPALAFYARHGLAVDVSVDGVAYMREHMGVAFQHDAPTVPALVLRFTKPG